MTVPEVSGVADGQEAVATASKPKRVRTGCLTCRERHLKCDEGLPHCNNCRKSNRVCKRGLRLNFLDTQVQAPPQVAAVQEYKIAFLDESREIASEYKGGLGRYGLPEDSEHEPTPPSAHFQQPEPNLTYPYATNMPQAPPMAYQPLPPIQGILPDGYASELPQGVKYEAAQDHFQSASHSTNDSPFSQQNTVVGSTTTYSQPEQELEVNEKREWLSTQEETLFMQVFVEEVGLWMDSMDPMKHFSRLLPFHALQEPMLLNAFLACGARHLTLVNPIYSEEKALHYYDTATRYLLKNLQDPNRDTVICATTAVILNVYEIMSERALQRMNHIAGARALIKECGWNARASGIGSACFWLNVGLEVLSCLHFNWQVAWDPEDWGVDMNLTVREEQNGREEIWTHRILYIVAKVANFRATIPRFQEQDAREEARRQQNRYAEWQRLKDWADAWNENIPRTMHPMAFLYPYQTTSKSAFPEVWLIKRTTIVARLFYHTVMVLLAQIHPYLGPDVAEMQDMQRRHSQMICGISAHVKDRGVASVAIRSLAHAAECLTNRREQEEVLSIFEKINKETGWRISFVFKELKEKWGWNDDIAPQQQQHQQAQQQAQQQQQQQQQPQPQQQQHQQHQQQQQQQPLMTSNQPLIQAQVPLQTYQYPPNLHTVTLPATPAAPLPPLPQQAQPQPQSQERRRPPSGIINPMYATADFTMPQHPYQNVYVAPNVVNTVPYNNPLAHQIQLSQLYY